MKITKKKIKNKYLLNKLLIISTPFLKLNWGIIRIKNKKYII